MHARVGMCRRLVAAAAVVAAVCVPGSSGSSGARGRPGFTLVASRSESGSTSSRPNGQHRVSRRAIAEPAPAAAAARSFLFTIALPEGTQLRVEDQHILAEKLRPLLSRAFNGLSAHRHPATLSMSPARTFPNVSCATGGA